MSYLILTRNWLYILGSVILFVLFSSEMAQAAQSAAERGVGGIVASGIVQYRTSWAVVIGINRYTKAPRLNYASERCQEHRSRSAAAWLCFGQDTAPFG